MQCIGSDVYIPACVDKSCTHDCNNYLIKHKLLNVTLINHAMNGMILNKYCFISVINDSDVCDVFIFAVVFC